MHQSYLDFSPCASPQAFFAQFECAPLSSIIWRGVVADTSNSIVKQHSHHETNDGDEQQSSRCRFIAHTAAFIGPLLTFGSIPAILTRSRKYVL